MRRYIQPLFFCHCLLAISGAALAQGQQQAQQQQQIILPQRPPGPHPQERSRIDGLRLANSIQSEDALTRSREFLRIDSTYYLGWMYEGVYKYNHAADYLGYKNAIVPLERAMAVCERDYRRDLATHSPELLKYYFAAPRQVDYAQLAFYLTQCYLNTEDPARCYALLRRVTKWNFQRDFFDAYNYLAWLTHRNRFYTKDKYPFLGNSIDENEALANRYLDTSLRRIATDEIYNAHIFPPGAGTGMRLGVYHYKAMIYAYQLNIDSAEHYYGKMKESTHFPHNNYATFKTVCGDFRTAETEYRQASMQDPGDKRLQEWAYYTSILNIYKALPKRGELQMKDMIQNAGSTPGFGWYNIALARCLYYDGQIPESERYTEKAAGFKELHIGTTLGQSHYDFAIQLNKLMTKQAEWEMQRFEHANWWYNFGVLGSMAGIIGERYLQEFLIINQFAQNPERDRVIYKLFSDESVITWDEVWHLIEDFGTPFFRRKFEDALANDPRKNIKRYFQYFLARLDMKDGKYNDAQEKLQNILTSEGIDEEYEMLLIARSFEALAQCADARDDVHMKSEWMNRLYSIYPQLIPFDGVKMNMQLTVQGQPDDEFVTRLKECNINWTSGGVAAPRAYLSFFVREKTKLVNYSVLDAAGKTIVPQQTFSYTDVKSGAVSIAYRLFGIGGIVPKEKENADEISMK